MIFFRHRANEFPRLLELLIRRTWHKRIVCAAFWAPRELFEIKLCDVLSKYRLFPKLCRISDNSVLVRTSVNEDFIKFKRIKCNFGVIKKSIMKSLSEWELFCNQTKFSKCFCLNKKKMRFLCNQGFTYWDFLLYLGWRKAECCKCRIWLWKIQ